jgi:AcrR family transcriptional regulator
MNDDQTTPKESKRLAILDAAAQVLAVQPAASLAEIADHAGIGKATLHRYFAGRDDLILALAFRALESISAAIQACHLEQGSAPQALQRLCTALVPLGDKIHFLLSESAPDTHPDFIAANERTEAPIVALLLRGQAEGSIRADLSPTWMLYSMNFLLFAAWQAVYDGRLARHDAPAMLLTTLLEGLGRPAP